MRRVSAMLGLAFAAAAMAQAPEKAKLAATVNGRPIPVAAVERALKPIPPDSHDKARPDILNYLIDNALVDHYLELLQVGVTPQEVEVQLATFKKDVAEAKQEYAVVLTKMEITEPELKVEIQNQLRWDKFVASQGTDEKLRKLFEGSPEIFDGSTVRARHILVMPATKDAAGMAAAKAKAAALKAAVTEGIAKGAKAPADADNLTKQKFANKAVDDAFAAVAREHSACPATKRDGGDLGEFPRMGSMVEPFAKAAFAMQPFEVSGPVETPFGYHLILVTGKKAGEPVKFETVKEAVLVVFGGRIREAVIAKMKADPNTKIEIAK